MSDAQRQRPQSDGSVRDVSSVEGDYASAPVGASLGPEDLYGEVGRAGRPKDESERVAVISGRSEDTAIAVKVVGRTDVGLVREHNEDNYLLADLATGSRDPKTFHEVSTAGMLLAVCDGMGGAAAGEVASQMAVDTLYEMMRRSVPAPDRDALARSLVCSVEEAGARIFEAARADRSRRGMGTTATVATLMDKTLFVGQVGDSRAYILRAGDLKQITKDQSLVNQLIEAGQLTEDEAEAFEHSNIILQALGTTEQVSVDLTFLELRRGDRLLMCSDGLSGLVHGDVIREVLNEQTDLEACCERLIELAKAGGGHDNVTVILAEFTGPGLAQPLPTDLVGYQQYPLPLDPERRPASALHSDMPTLSPPPSPSPSTNGADSSAAQDPPAMPTRSSAGGKLLLVVLLLGSIGYAIYYWTVVEEERARQLEAHQMVEPPAEEKPPLRVEVVVRTDVEAGELYVDDESYGTSPGGQWILELPPGPHRLEARAGGSSVTSSLVTVREGVPATVHLTMPEGVFSTSDAGGAEAAEPTAAEPKPTVRLTKRDRVREGVDGGRARPRERAVETTTPTTSTPGAATTTPGAGPTPAPSSEPVFEPGMHMMKRDH